MQAALQLVWNLGAPATSSQSTAYILGLVLQPVRSIGTLVRLKQAASQQPGYIHGLCAKRSSRWTPIGMSLLVTHASTALVLHRFCAVLHVLSCMCAGAGGSLQAALEQSLSSSLAAPLHESLHNNFDASLIPAFERATRVSFSLSLSLFVLDA